MIELFSFFSRAFDHMVQNDATRKSGEGGKEENVHPAAARQTDQQQVHQACEDFLVGLLFVSS